MHIIARFVRVTTGKQCDNTPSGCEKDEMIREVS